MPLIAKQHILHVDRGNVEKALEALEEQMNALPPVRIVTMDIKEATVNFAGKLIPGIRVFAVVEEV
ncbi:hypothetical protein [Microbacterium algeriense]|uniref:Uncharacterized protein n=1 Tax=Microbacterium algeriense TaxID=2615184 RepID=A0ABQ6V5Q4_9MICO|nr:hypothetical protein [Microbacterium algeriense]KAB1864572.1 hypothetical protein F6A08_10765 [Microbacterium algeriense]